MAEEQTRSFIKYLSDFVGTYNDTIHSYTKRCSLIYKKVFVFDPEHLMKYTRAQKYNRSCLKNT